MNNKNDFRESDWDYTGLGFEALFFFFFSFGAALVMGLD